METRHFALVSAYDKTGLVDFCRGLVRNGLGLLSTGGSARTLSEAGLELELIEKMTGMGAVLDHRVVTLQAQVHMGLLADLSNPKHLAQLKEHNAVPIDIVVGGFYPFGIDPADFEHGDSPNDQIDVGGPCMARAGVKGDRVVVIDPTDYPLVLSELETKGEVTEEVRRYLKRKVFERTSQLDGNIAKLFV
jgi:phosphoribosylaminoimidazolecarboxamide formyltransferase/IMP cyclohydrolase